VALHREGWTDKSIARYMKVDRSTVYRVRKRLEEEGEEGLEDRPAGRPKGVQKVDLRAVLEARRMQENPELGEFRVQAALEQAGIRLIRRTVGRILAANRKAEGLKKPSRGRKEKREMPFEASFRHQLWASDVRYLEHSIPATGQAYVVAILENYSRAILASAVTLSQDTNAYLSVLHAAIERHGSPKTIVTDGGGIFRSDRAKAVYRVPRQVSRTKLISGNVLPGTFARRRSIGSSRSWLIAPPSQERPGRAQRRGRSLELGLGRNSLEGVVEGVADRHRDEDDQRHLCDPRRDLEDGGALDAFPVSAPARHLGHSATRSGAGLRRPGEPGRALGGGDRVPTRSGCVVGTNREKL
jgi:transposase